jgi:hypothetical protein
MKQATVLLQIVLALLFACNLSTQHGDSVAVPGNFTSSSANEPFVRLEWDAVDGATRYAVFRSSDSAAGFADTMHSLTEQTFFVDRAIEAGQTWYYKVRAKSEAEMSDFTEVVQYTAPDFLFLSPTALDRYTAGDSIAVVISAVRDAHVGMDLVFGRETKAIRSTTFMVQDELQQKVGIPRFYTTAEYVEKSGEWNVDTLWVEGDACYLQLHDYNTPSTVYARSERSFSISRDHRALRRAVTFP